MLKYNSSIIGVEYGCPLQIGNYILYRATSDQIKMFNVQDKVTEHNSLNLAIHYTVGEVEIYGFGYLNSTFNNTFELCVLFEGILHKICNCFGDIDIEGIILQINKSEYVLTKDGNIMESQIDVLKPSGFYLENFKDIYSLMEKKQKSILPWKNVTKWLHLTSFIEFPYSIVGERLKGIVTSDGKKYYIR